MKPVYGRIAVVLFLVAVAAFVWYLSTHDPTPRPKASVHSEDQPNPRPQSPAPVAKTPDAPPAGKTEASDKDPALRTIRGRVLDSRSQAVAGAAIRAFKLTFKTDGTVDHFEEVTSDKAPVVSASDGSFAVADVPDSVYDVAALHPGYLPASERTQAGAAAITLVLSDTTNVTGIVVSAQSNAPIADFEITWIPGAPDDDLPGILNRKTWTPVHDAGGRFLLDDVAAGMPLTVAAIAPGHMMAYAEIPPIEKAMTHADVIIQLQPGCRVEGSVVDAAGGPVDGASVFIGKDTRGKCAAATDAAGRFVLTTLSPADSLLSVTHPRYYPGETAIEPRVGATVRVRIVLDEAGAVEGTVRQGGMPLSGARVLIADRSVESGPDGHYVLYGISAGWRTVSVLPREAKASAPRIKQTVSVENGKTALLDFDLPASFAALEGSVLIENQAPQSGSVAVEVKGAVASERQRVDLSPEGAYRIEDLAPGTATVIVDATDARGVRRQRAATLDIGEGETIHQNFVFEMPAPVTVNVSGLQPGEQAAVLVLRDAVESLDIRSFEDVIRLMPVASNSEDLASDGPVDFNGLDPGTYTLVAIAIQNGDVHLQDQPADAAGLPHLRAASQVVHLTAGRAASLSLQLR